MNEKLITYEERKFKVGDLISYNGKDERIGYYKQLFVIKSHSSWTKSGEELVWHPVYDLCPLTKDQTRPDMRMWMHFKNIWLTSVPQEDLTLEKKEFFNL